MIDKKLIPFGGLKKEPFSGSHHGMRYFFRGDDGKSSTTFTVYVYPEPWCFEDTPDEEKESATFPLSDEGMDQAIAWLFERFEAEKPRWINASKETMHTVNSASWYASDFPDMMCFQLFQSISFLFNNLQKFF